jgi:hypothetical protein
MVVQASCLLRTPVPTTCYSGKKAAGTAAATTLGTMHRGKKSASHAQFEALRITTGIITATINIVRHYRTKQKIAE